MGAWVLGVLCDNVSISKLPLVSFSSFFLSFFIIYLFFGYKKVLAAAPVFCIWLRHSMTKIVESALWGLVWFAKDELVIRILVSMGHLKQVMLLIR